MKSKLSEFKLIEKSKKVKIELYKNALNFTMYNNDDLLRMNHCLVMYYRQGKYKFTNIYADDFFEQIEISKDGKRIDFDVYEQAEDYPPNFLYTIKIDLENKTISA